MIGVDEREDPSVEALSAPSVGELLCRLDAPPEQSRKVRDLGERLVGHVLRAIDRSKLDLVEQMLACELMQLGVPDDEMELQRALVADALFRIGHMSDRVVDLVPPGITEAERIAAELDDDCPMCHWELEQAKRQLEAGGDDWDEDHDEWRELMADAARSWRRENAEALTRFGLG